jgi:uncharacterized protein with HEPN domain
MSDKDHHLILRHMLSECEFILSQKGKGLSFGNFMADETVKRAVVRSLEVLGEATKQIPVDVKLQWNAIDWKAIAGMRDRLIHDYMGVNYTIVWDVVQNRIPELERTIRAILDSEE